MLLHSAICTGLRWNSSEPSSFFPPHLWFRKNRIGRMLRPGGTAGRYHNISYLDDCSVRPLEGKSTVVVENFPFVPNSWNLMDWQSKAA